jgi:hypothetical protein
MARKDDAEVVEYSKKSLRLFEFIDKEYKTYSQERIEKIEALKGRIDFSHKKEK